MFFRDVVTGLEHESAQLLGRHLGIGGVRWLQAQHPEQALHEQIDEPHHRIEQAQQWFQHEGDWQGDSLCIGGTDHLGGDFRKYQDQKGNGQRANGECDLVIAKQAHGNHADQHRGGCIDKVVTKQNYAKQAVGLRQQIGGKAGATVAGTQQGFQPVTVQSHHAGFCDREEARQEQQDAEHNKLYR